VSSAFRNVVLKEEVEPGIPLLGQQGWTGWSVRRNTLAWSGSFFLMVQPPLLSQEGNKLFPEDFMFQLSKEEFGSSWGSRAQPRSGGRV